MFENSPYICYIFFAIEDVIVTSVNTYASVMGISTEGKYRATWSNLCEKALIKKIDNTDNVRTVRGWPLANTSNNSNLPMLSVFWSALSVPQDSSFC